MKLKAIILTSSLLSIGAQAAYFGTYERGSPTWFSGRYVSYEGQLSGARSTHFLCTDTNQNRVPGRITGTTCDVEWKGKEYKNSDYFMLVNNRFNWVTLTAQNKSWVMDKGVSPGVIDEGNYTYHCKITFFLNGNSAAGKYIPSRDGCYYGWYGAGKFQHVNDGTSKLEVLVNPW